MNSLNVSLSQAAEFLQTGKLLVKKKENERFSKEEDIYGMKIEAELYLMEWDDKEDWYPSKWETLVRVGDLLQLLCGRQKIWHCPKCNHAFLPQELQSSENPAFCPKGRHWVKCQPLVVVPSEIKDAGQFWEITAEAGK